MNRQDRKFIFIDVVDSGLRLQGKPVEAGQSLGQKLASLLALPAMIAGGLLGAVFFSAFLTLLLIPLAIWGSWTWWRVRKLKTSQPQDIIDGVYTVVDRKTSDD